MENYTALDCDRTYGSLLHHLNQQSKASKEGKRMFRCINCKSEEHQTVVDLGMHPIVNNLLETYDQQEPLFPLKVGKCRGCGHFSTGNPLPATQVFSEKYPFRTGVNEGYLKQCRAWVDKISLVHDSQILEIGCNDSSLRRIFHENGFKNVNGIDPCTTVIAPGVIKDFFTDSLACDLSDNGDEYDLIIANNVIGHVPDLEDFISGMKRILAPRGKISIEIPDFTHTIKRLQFDTIYHEHYSYFTPLTIQKIFQRHELYMTEITPIPSHGGSYRYTFEREDRFPINLDFCELETVGFQEKVEWELRENLSLIVHRGYNGKIAAFGAAAKGITMLNCLGVKPWLVNFCVDETPEKIGKFLPGSRIPIYGLQSLYNLKPDYLLILPWNHEAEIREKTKFIAEWGGKHLCLNSQTPKN